jgi:hypothetical protein
VPMREEKGTGGRREGGQQAARELGGARGWLYGRKARPEQAGSGGRHGRRDGGGEKSRGGRSYGRTGRRVRKREEKLVYYPNGPGGWREARDGANCSGECVLECVGWNGDGFGRDKNE